jgi:DNA-binding FadR family transcriptional regulator
LLERFMNTSDLTRRALDFHRRIVEEIELRDADAAALMARKHVNDLRAIWEQAGLDLELQVGAVDSEQPLAISG